MSTAERYSSEAFNRLPFREKLDLLYQVPGRQKRDLILGSPDAQRLVRSFAVESLFYTVKQVGLEDSAELLALASGEQIRGVVDLDCWKKDRLDVEAMLDWLAALVEGGSMPLGEFLNVVDLDLLVLLLKRFIRVYRQDDPDEPPLAEGPEVFELDAHYPIVFHRWDARAPLVRQLLEELHERDYSYFVTVLEEVWWGVETQLEESSFQVRNARLQDCGFPDYYEALEIYRPLAETTLAERDQPLSRAASGGEEEIPLERSLLVPDGARSFLAEILSEAFDLDGGDELRREMALLSNRVMVAEGVDYTSQDSVAEAVRLAHHTVNLALEYLSGRDRRRGLDVVRRRYVLHLFRLGWGLLLDLRRFAKQAEEALGLAAAGVDFLDTPYREALAGFLRPKPRYFEGLDRAGEIHYRAIGSLADLERAREVLGEIASIPALAQSLLGQSLPQLARLRPDRADDFRLSAAFLTGFANYALGRVPSVQPIDLEELSRLRHATLDPETVRLRSDLRQRFTTSVGAVSDTRFIDFCLRRFEEEFLPISPARPIDSRFVTCLMLAPGRTVSDTVFP